MGRARERSLLELIDAQGVAYGREDSCKMSKGRLLADRFLIGIRTGDLPARAALNIAATIGMPKKLRPDFLARIGAADVVLFGMEDSETGPAYKTYLEFWQKIRRDVIASGSTEPALMNLGFKWSARDNWVNVVSRYTCYPMLDLAGILGRVRAIYDGHEDRPSCWAARRLIHFASTRRAPFMARDGCDFLTIYYERQPL